MAFSKNQSIDSILALQMTEQALTIKGFSFAHSNSIQDTTADWDIAAPPNNLFLQRRYLQLLERNAPEGMRFSYLTFYKKERPVGVAICQIQGFNAEQSLQKEGDHAQKGDGEVRGTACFFTAVGNYLKSFVAKRVDFNTLTCGNLLLTGEHGFYFNPAEVQPEEAFQLVEEGLDKTRAILRKQKLDISVTLVKDYFNESRPAAKILMKKNYNEFTIQPNMVLDIRPEWKTFEDYTGAMFSKYRVRVKRAFKKGKDIEKREFSTEDIEANLDRMYELYESIAINAGFNVMKLNKTYFLALKRTLGDKFKLTAYYLEGELIGYHTLIRNHKELEAHFLGFDKSKNSSHQIYLNMLYDMVRVGVEEGFEKIVFARTALEIKSSVGAVAHDMYCFMRHKYNLSNKFFTPIYDYLKPDLNWTPRKPFKEVEVVAETKIG